MKIDTVLGVPPARMAETAREAEAAGFAAGWTVEMNHDPFLAALAAAGATDRLELGTSIAVAFARTPMTLAQLGWDLQAYSGGRFSLGLGSQVKPHIEKRYGMPWSPPAARMREMVLAIRAIWESWSTGGRLDFRGEHFRHTLMTPDFMPDPADLGDHGLPPILVAGVGPLMTDVAAEVADGFVVHPFTTERYLDEVTLPRLRAGRERAGRPWADYEVSASPLVATGETDDDLAASTEMVRRRVGFYASTPSYRPVLERHGWEGVQEELARLIRAQEWASLGAAIPDEMLAEFAIIGAEDELPERLRARYGGRATRISLAPARPEDAEILARTAVALRHSP